MLQQMGSWSGKGRDGVGRRAGAPSASAMVEESSPDTRQSALRARVLALTVACLALAVCVSASAATDEAADDDGSKPSGLVGPSSAPGQLESDVQDRRGVVSIDAIDGALSRWFDAKSRVRDRTGLLIGTEYVMLPQGGGPAVGPEEFAASGRWALFGTWTLVDRSGPMAGDLVVRGENRHDLGTVLAPASLNTSLGTNQSTAVVFSDAGWLLTNLYWHQRLSGGKYSLLVGQVDPTDYVDTYAWVNPWTTFLNGSFGNSPTIAMPNQTFGLAVGALPGDHLYLVAGVADPDGDPARPFDTFFQGGEVFVHAEVGWVASMEKRHEDNVHITGWYASARPDRGIGSGWGLNFSGCWRFADVWTPFLRGGFALGQAARAKGYVAAGLGLEVRKADLLGIGLAWTRPANPGARDQYTAEIFYRLHVLRNLAVTPDVQVVLNPTGRSAGSAVGIAGLRVRLHF